jgi:hypothetical protein
MIMMMMMVVVVVVMMMMMMTFVSLDAGGILIGKHQLLVYPGDANLLEENINKGPTG